MLTLKKKIIINWKEKSEFNPKTDNLSSENYLSPDWRREQRNHWCQTLTTRLNLLAQRIEDDIETTIKEAYDPTIKGAYLLMGSTCSTKLRVYELCWSPLSKMLTRWNILVDPSHEGRGIGTAVTEMTEGLAIDLGAKQIVIDAIVNEKSLHYWAQRPGYTLVGQKAIRNLEIF
ncbi:MAG: GNAT family N-acetyltransferase [Nanoarchaeota archaeon]